MDTTLTCPYCEQSFTYNGYTAQRELSIHKARCPKKRYLGGELAIGRAQDARKLLMLDSPITETDVVSETD